MNAEPVIEVQGLVKGFKGIQALSGVDLTIRRAEFVALAGPDGAGKTTLLRILSGLTDADRGRVRVLGHDLPHGVSRLKRRFGYLPQRFSHYLDLTVAENLAFFARVYGVRDFSARRDALLAFTGLGPFQDRLAEHLSGGMKQKLALACTLIHEPELLLLDEPTTGVDPVSRREFAEILAGLLRRGMTILMATPYLDEAERCHRTVLLHAGRVLADGPPEALKSSFGTGLFETSAHPVRSAVRALRALAGVAQVHAVGERVHFRLRPGSPMQSVDEALRAAGVTFSPPREVSPSLEDVFIARMGPGGPAGDARVGSIASEVNHS